MLQMMNLLPNLPKTKTNKAGTILIFFLLFVMESVRTRALRTFKLVIRSKRLKINWTVQFATHCLQLERISFAEQEDRSDKISANKNVVEWGLYRQEWRKENKQTNKQSKTTGKPVWIV